jgi:uncharacterized protein with gpF-like domain
MKLRAPGKSIILPPLHPNVGVEIAYRKELLGLVAKMHHAIQEAIQTAYPAHLAQDMSPIQGIAMSAMRAKMEGLRRQWIASFEVAAPPTASKFVTAAFGNTESALAGQLRSRGFAVKFQPSKGAMEAYESAISDQVGLIKSIASEHLDRVEKMVLESVREGRAMRELQVGLKEAFGITANRARLIAENQNNRASGIIGRTRKKELGITKGIWRHSGGGKDPRPEHEEWDGTTYDLDEGKYSEDDGEVEWPGTAPNCRCVELSVIPGLEDEGAEGEDAEAA